MWVLCAVRESRDCAQGTRMLDASTVKECADGGTLGYSRGVLPHKETVSSAAVYSRKAMLVFEQNDIKQLASGKWQRTQ